MEFQLFSGSQGGFQITKTVANLQKLSQNGFDKLIIASHSKSYVGSLTKQD